MIATRARRTTGGFSLIELLIAVAILIMLLGVMGGFVWTVLAARDAAAADAARHRAIDALFAGLERDAQAFIGIGPDGGPGFDGDAEGLRAAVRTVPVRLARPGAAAAALRDVAWVQYGFDERAGALTAGRAAPTGRPDPRSLDGFVHFVRFRYLEADGWRERFTSSAEAGLPIAIEVSIWYEPWSDAERERAELLRNPPDDAVGAIDDDALVDPLTDPALADDLDDDLDLFGAEDADDTRPLPDRRRVISIPDARPPADLAAGGDDLGFGDAP